ncbi:MAG: bacteriohemerythrin [Candidatus Omnitrophota bacterium]
MAIIEWGITLKVGIEVVDDQHKKLIGLINQLYDAMLAGRGDQVLGEILTELVAYTVYHFKTEEDLFRQNSYREAPEHIREHAELVKKVSEFKAAFDGGNRALTVDMMTFLKDWLIKHIMGSDKRYAPFLNSKGIR